MLEVFSFSLLPFLVSSFRSVFVFVFPVRSTFSMLWIIGIRGDSCHVGAGFWPDFVAGIVKNSSEQERGIFPSLPDTSTFGVNRPPV